MTWSLEGRRAAVLSAVWEELWLSTSQLQVLISLPRRDDEFRWSIRPAQAALLKNPSAFLYLTKLCSSELKNQSWVTKHRDKGQRGRLGSAVRADRHVSFIVGRKAMHSGTSTTSPVKSFSLLSYSQSETASQLTHIHSEMAKENEAERIRMAAEHPNIQ